MASKIVPIALIFAIGTAASTSRPAHAENGQIAAGVVGGLIGGALLGGALASRPAPPPSPVVYYRPEPAYVEGAVCTFVRERYWDGYYWQYRRVEVCS